MNRAVLVFCAVLVLASSAVAQDVPAPRVYPNPISGERVITVQTDTPEPARLEIFDVRGRVVPHDQPLAAGTYFVRLRYGNGTISEPTPITLVANGRRQFQLVGPAAQTEPPGMSFLSLTGPEITTLPADSLGLGDVQVGASGVQDTVFVRNDGDSDLTVSSAVLTLGGAFSIQSGGAGGVVAPGDSLEVVVYFAPTSVGAEADTLTIASDDLDEPSVEVELTGEGTPVLSPEIAVAYARLDFGTVRVGALVSDTVVVRNVGTSTLTVSSISIRGAAAYALADGGSGGPIMPGDSLAVVVSFAPVARGEHLATLTLASDDADEPTVEIAITGTVERPTYALMYVFGDSQAAGKGDPKTSCALRPDAIRRGYVYRRSTNRYVPVCDPVVDKEYNGSILPALVDEVWKRDSVISLVVFYTVKGSHLTPEASRSPAYWYMGDSRTPQGLAFKRAQNTLKKAERRLRIDFPGATIVTTGGIHSFGGVDAKMFRGNGAPDPVTQFQPRLAHFDAVVSGSSAYTLLYFELADTPDRPDINGVMARFRSIFASVVPAERIIPYGEYVMAQHVADGSNYSIQSWYADGQGHLGSLGLDYLGRQLAKFIDPNQ